MIDYRGREHHPVQQGGGAVQPGEDQGGVGGAAESVQREQPGVLHQDPVRAVPDRKGGWRARLGNLVHPGELRHGVGGVQPDQRRRAVLGAEPVDLVDPGAGLEGEPVAGRDRADAEHEDQVSTHPLILQGPLPERLPAGLRDPRARRVAVHRQPGRTPLHLQVHQDAPRHPRPRLRRQEGFI